MPCCVVNFFVDHNSGKPRAGQKVRELALGIVQPFPRTEAAPAGHRQHRRHHRRNLATLDTTRTYLPTGKPQGGPKGPRKPKNPNPHGGSDVRDVSRHHIVELGGIEPPSLSRWTNLLQPFPALTLTLRHRRVGCRLKACHASSFRHVSDLSRRQQSFLPSSPTSVAGLWWSGPVRHFCSR